MRTSPELLALEKPKRVVIHKNMGFTLNEIDKCVLRCSLFDSYLLFGTIYDEVLDQMPDIQKGVVKSSLDKLVRNFLMTKNKSYAGHVAYRKVKRNITLDNS